MSSPKKEETTIPESTTPETVKEAQTPEEPAEPVTVEAEVQETKESAPAATEREETGEEEIEVVEEKIYTIPISKLGYTTDRGHRAPRAVRDVKKYVSRHMRADEVAISNEINAKLWAKGINKPPRKITVRAVKDKEGRVVVYPAKT